MFNILKVFIVILYIFVFMADTVSKKRRSEIMRAVKGSNTKPELIVRRYLSSQGFKYRLNDKKLPGKPDVKIVKYKCVIFINGCFWHGHKNCRIYVMPKTNKAFWYTKIENNKKRDIKNYRRLRKLGWRVIVLWECQLKAKKQEMSLQKLVNKILN
jgi:DNA mismatch endonuclease (patch repair protein)